MTLSSLHPRSPVRRRARTALALAAVGLTAAVTAVVLSAPDAHAATIDTSAYYQVISRLSGKALAVTGASTANNAQIVQYPADSTKPEQQWQFVDSGGGYYRLKARHSAKVVDISARSTADGATVIQYTDNNATNQQFAVLDTDSGYLKLVNRNSGKALDVWGRSTADGAVISQYTDNGGTNQQWRLVRVATSTPPPGNHNPALPGYHADPQIRYLAGQYWIYPTTDGYDNWGATSFQAWSSPDLVSWTSQGVALDLANVSWCHTKAWAPTITYRDGSYWFYFAACQQIGVAKSASPAGPFVDALGHPLVSTSAYGEQEIDPDVFVDDDGTAYLYFGSGNAEVAKLSASMTALATTPTRITPASYREAPNVFKRNGTYYPDVLGERHPRCRLPGGLRHRPLAPRAVHQGRQLPGAGQGHQRGHPRHRAQFGGPGSRARRVVHRLPSVPHPGRRRHPPGGVHRPDDVRHRWVHQQDRTDPGRHRRGVAGGRPGVHPSAPTLP